MSRNLSRDAGGAVVTLIVRSMSLDSIVSNIGVTLQPLGDDEEFVRSELSRSSVILPRKVAQLLGRCANWDTPRNHAAHIADDLGLSSTNARWLTELLSDLTEKQLLTSEDTMQSEFARAAQSAANTGGRIGSIVIVSRNRPGLLRRCVMSYADHIRRFKKRVDIVVFDDSDEIGFRDQTPEWFSALSLPDNVRFFYYGAKQKAELARRLAQKAGCAPDIVRFAICRSSSPVFAAGASRNAALLTTHGQMFISADDDGMCDLSETPNCRAGLRFSSAPDPTEWWFFENRESVHEHVPATEVDLIGSYERLLGRTVASLVEEEGPVRLDGMNFPFFRSAIQPDARVLLCETGYKGDRSIEVPALYLALEGPSYDRLVRSESCYRSAFRSREVVRSVSQATISNNASCTTNNLAIDNRTMVPPFLPRQRGEDILFSMSVKLCHKNCFFAHLPIAVLHDPDPRRTFESIPATDFVPGMRSAHLVALLIQRFSRHFEFQSELPAENLLAMGRYFTLLASQPFEQFHSFVRDEWLHQTRLAISSLKKQIAGCAGTAPGFWVADLRTHLEVLKAALLRAAPCPIDMVSDPNDGMRAWEVFQETLFSYGQLLEKWPALLRTAATLGDSPHCCALTIPTARLEAEQEARCFGG